MLQRRPSQSKAINSAASAWQFQSDFDRDGLRTIISVDLGLEVFHKTPCLWDALSVYEFIIKVGIVSDEAIPQDSFGNLKTISLNKLFPGCGISIPNNEPFDEIVEFLL